MKAKLVFLPGLQLCMKLVGNLYAMPSAVAAVKCQHTHTHTHS